MEGGRREVRGERRKERREKRDKGGGEREREGERGREREYLIMRGTLWPSSACCPKKQDICD